MEAVAEEKHFRWHNAYLIPAFFALAIWLIKLYEFYYDINFASFGILPRTFKGLIGIITSPLIHGDWNHLANNTLPLLILGSGVVYFYRELAFKIFLLIWFMTGLWVWMGARESFHIGASGIIYGLAAFVFVSGIIKKYPSLMALSLLVVYLYGSMIWGILPINTEISWESHLYGAVAGLILAINYRNKGPIRPKYQYELEEENEEEIHFDNETQEPDFETPASPQIRYIYRPDSVFPSLPQNPQSIEDKD